MATRSNAWFPSERAIQRANGDLQHVLGVPLKSVSNLQPGGSRIMAVLVYALMSVSARACLDDTSRVKRHISEK